jgi:hypothetical protein
MEGENVGFVQRSKGLMGKQLRVTNSVEAFGGLEMRIQ